MVRIVDPEEREVDVLRRLVAFRDMNVLDVGCGDGRTTRRIARTASSVIGVDPDPERIALAHEAGLADAQHLDRERSQARSVCRRPEQRTAPRPQ